jgi:DNA repair protein RadC
MFDFTICEVQVSYKPKMRVKDLPLIETSRSAYEYALAFWKDIEYCESFCIMLLNRANKLLGIRKVSDGGITGTMVDVRIIFSTALKGMATSIICVHNHPSGNLQPSDADLRITRNIKEAGKILDITVVDHLIIAPDGYFSFADNGKI